MNGKPGFQSGFVLFWGMLDYKYTYIYIHIHMNQELKGTCKQLYYYLGCIGLKVFLYWGGCSRLGSGSGDRFLTVWCVRLGVESLRDLLVVSRE